MTRNRVRRGPWRHGLALVLGVLLSAVGCGSAAPSSVPSATATARASASAVSRPTIPTGAGPTSRPAALDSVQPTTIFFDSPQHGWVAGSTIESVAAAFETSDGGATWTTTDLGRGRPTVMGGLDALLVGRTCPFDGMEFPDVACGDGTFQWVDGSWTGVSDAALTMIASNRSATVTASIAVDPPRDERGFPLPDIATVRGGGSRGTQGVNPCGKGMLLVDLAWSSDTDLLGLCEGEGATGGSEKVLYRSTDDGLTWSPFASTEAHTLPRMGTGVRMSMAPDGTGWAWALRLGMVATSDGGATWLPSNLAEAESVWVVAASALGGGSGWLLLHDSPDSLHLYFVAADGSKELRATFTARATPG